MPADPSTTNELLSMIHQTLIMLLQIEKNNHELLKKCISNNKIDSIDWSEALDSLETINTL
jgi:hypothetical protein